MIPYPAARDWTVARSSRVAHVLDRTGAITAMNVLELRATGADSVADSSHATHHR